MRQIDYSDFGDRIMARIGQKPKPINGQWAVTHNCNLDCVHCFVAKDKKSRELGYSQITHLLDEIYREGCLVLTFTGGEPFIREDFLDIYTYAKKKGFLITILTNGTLLDKGSVDYLKKYPPLMIEITLHSIKPDTFERITRVKESFNRCMEGIRLILDRGLPLTLKTVGLTINKEDILKTKEFIRSFVSVKYKFDSLVLPRHDGSRDNLKFRLSPQDVVDIERKDREMLRQWQDCIYGKDESDSFITPRPFRCGAGMNSFYINAYGSLRLCSEMVRPTFDLEKNSFHTGFYAFLYQLRLSYPHMDDCDKCGVKHLCCACPAVFLLENNGIPKPADYLCRVAHLRKEYIR